LKCARQSWHDVKNGLEFFAVERVISALRKIDKIINFRFNFKFNKLCIVIFYLRRIYLYKKNSSNIRWKYQWYNNVKYEDSEVSTKMLEN